jgi:hypothetical protein
MVWTPNTRSKQALQASKQASKQGSSKASDASEVSEPSKTNLLIADACLEIRRHSKKQAKQAHRQHISQQSE